MSRLEIQQVHMPKDAGRFVKSWWRVYRDDPMWVPPLVFERKAFFDPKKNPYWNNAHAGYFMAIRDGEAVGTIGVCVDHLYQQDDEGCGFFGFFEFVDDVDVARALFEAGCAWLREQGMVRVLGPFMFNTNQEFGLLVDGFDTTPTIANPHNSAYYEAIYLELGLKKAMNWYAYLLPRELGVPPKIKRVSDWYLKRHPEVNIRTVDVSRWDEEAALIYKVYDDAWEHNWAHVKLTEPEFKKLTADFKQILDPSLCFIVEVDGEVAGMSITLPDYNKVVKKMNGGLFPFGWYHFLFGRKAIDQIRIFILGIRQEYQHMPLGAPIYVKTWERGLEMGMRAAEASLILETNHRMRGALEKMGAYAYKTYRTYEFLLSDEVSWSELTQKALDGEHIADPPPYEMRPPK